jgi:hypothetical protein
MSAYVDFVVHIKSISNITSSKFIHFTFLQNALIMMFSLIAINVKMSVMLHF